jgi:predicted nuclease of predicted toxin-antitoxin system
MRILVDENIPRMTVDALMALGNDVKDIRGTSAKGLPDAELWRLAATEARLFITTDRGFSEFRTVSHQESEWSNFFVVVRDTTMVTSRSGGHPK